LFLASRNEELVATPPGDDRGGCRDHYDDNGGHNDNKSDHSSAAVDTRSRNNGL